MGIDQGENQPLLSSIRQVGRLTCFSRQSDLFSNVVQALRRSEYPRRSVAQEDLEAKARL